MIVLCHKALAGTGAILEREFFKYFISRIGKRAVVANEVWSAFRYRTIATQGRNAKDMINGYRGFVRPETINLNENYEEFEPKDYCEKELIKASQDLVERKWGEVDYFIRQLPEKYASVKTVTQLSLEEFYASCMDNAETRTIVSDFSEYYAKNKYE